MNQTIVALSALIFLHNGNFIPKTDFRIYPCEKEKIYITGLNESNAYAKVGEQQELVEDQQLFNLSIKNKQIDVLTKDNILIKELAINWINDCKFDDDELKEHTTTTNNQKKTNDKGANIVTRIIDIQQTTKATTSHPKEQPTSKEKAASLTAITSKIMLSTKEVQAKESSHQVSKNITKLNNISEKQIGEKATLKVKEQTIISNDIIIMVASIIGLLLLGWWFLKI